MFKETLKRIEDSKRRVESGLLNCIPSPFTRYSEYWSGLERSKYIGVTASPKVGKCFGEETNILMFDGSIKNIKSINNGDLLMGPDSLPRIVSGITSGNEKMFTIKRKNQNDITVNNSHILYLYDRKKKQNISITVKDYLLLSENKKSHFRWIQSDKVIFQNIMPCIIEPYFYGLWLGDGNSDSLGITNTDKEIINYLYDFASKNRLIINNIDIRYFLKDKTILLETDINKEVKRLWNNLDEASNYYNIKSEYISRAIKSNKVVNNSKWYWLQKRGDFKNLFSKECGFNKTKINKKYLLNSTIENREKLLAGLIDSDGYLDKKQGISFVLKHKSLVEDISFLSRSLGLRVTNIKEKIVNKNIYYYIRITGNNLKNIPVLLKRKKYSKEKEKYNKLHHSFTIENNNNNKYFGFTVDKDHLFLLSDFSIVHNTQFTDFMFMYHPISYVLFNETNIKIDVLYFSLEMSKQQKALQAISYFLYTEKGISISPVNLRSVRKALDSDVITAIKEIEPLLTAFFDKIKFNDHTRNRYGIWLDILNYAKENGEIIYETKNYSGTPQLVMTGYKPNDPDKITIIIVDHVSLLNPQNKETLHDTIGKFSSEDLIRARNLFGFTPILVQQQAASQESLENRKADALMPNLAGLADNKLTARDWDVGFGLFSPFRHGTSTFKGYDITRFKDRFRSLEILVNREGGGNELCPLYFRGESSYFKELPLANTEELRNFTI